jgi:hypothetical protein
VERLGWEDDVMASFIRFLVATAAVVGSLTPALSSETERDSCTCKLVEKGAQSTLKGGTCVRTEASNCLMEWGTGGTEKVGVGNGSSQSQAASKAEGLVIKAAGSSFRLEPLVQVSGERSPLSIAIANLSNVPPEKYTDNGIPESFVLAAVTALIRFDTPVDDLASSLLGDRRNELLSAVEKGGSFTVDSLTVKGRFGCLQISDENHKAQIYIKTPFAGSESC